MNEAPVASFKSKRNRSVSRQTYVELNSNSFAYSFPPISPAARANVWMTASTSVATNIRRAGYRGQAIGAASMNTADVSSET
jgi:hypothetical protein